MTFAVAALIVTSSDDNYSTTDYFTDVLRVCQNAYVTKNSNPHTSAKKFRCDKRSGWNTLTTSQPAPDLLTTVRWCGSTNKRKNMYTVRGIESANSLKYNENRRGSAENWRGSSDTRL